MFIKRESILSLCEPRALFKGFNQNPIQKTHWLWDDAKMLTSLPGFRLQSDITVPPLYCGRIVGIRIGLYYIINVD